MRCVFCDIAAGRGIDRIVYQDDRIVAIEDAAPAATCHLLIIPRSHIRNMHDCVPGDAALLRDMDAVGRRLLRRRMPGSRVKLGYHVPPFVSVDHLHLHAFALPHVPRWKGVVKYSLPGVWCPSDRLVASLSYN